MLQGDTGPKVYTGAGDIPPYETFEKWVRGAMYDPAMPDPDKEPEKTLEWLLEKANRVGLGKMTVQEQKLLKQLHKILFNNVSIKGDYLFHEYIQTFDFGTRLGGGNAEFFNSQQGIEGIFTTLSGKKIPFSLKRVTPDINNKNSVKNVFREINDNAGKIRKAYNNGDDLVKKYCVFGDNPNTYILINVVNLSKETILNYYNSIDESRRDLLFGGKGVFKEIIIKDKDGLEVVFENYKLRD